MANKKVICMEIGSKYTRFVEVDYKIKNPKVYNIAAVKTPEGAFDDGMLTVTPEYATTLKKRMSQCGIKAKHVIFSIISTKIASREIFVPKVKENRIAALVEANASDYFPVNLDDYELGHMIMDTVKEESGEEKYKLMVMAFSKTMLAGYEALAEACGLTVIGYDYSGNSVYQFTKKECGGGVSMIIKLDGRSSMITVTDEGSLVLQRTIANGVDGVVNTYIDKEAKHYTYHDVLEVFKKHNYFDAANGEEGPIYDGASLADYLVEAFAYTLRGISRIYDFYNSRNGQKQISKIYITGVGASVSGLPSYLHDRLGVDAEDIKMDSEYVFDKNMDIVEANRYISCFGAALAPLYLVEAKKEEKKKTAEKKESVGNHAVTFLAACVVISMVLMVMGAVPFISEKTKKDKNVKRVEELASMIPIYQEYIATKNAYNYLNEAYEYTVLPTETLVDFIEEMEQKMPKNMYVTSFAANKEGVSFSVVVNTKQQAADALLQLRTFESLTNISIREIIDTNGEGVAGTVTFAVTADYVNAKPDVIDDMDNIGVVAGEADILE